MCGGGVCVCMGGGGGEKRGGGGVGGWKVGETAVLGKRVIN